MSDDLKGHGHELWALRERVKELKCFCRVASALARLARTASGGVSLGSRSPSGGLAVIVTDWNCSPSRSF